MRRLASYVLAGCAGSGCVHAVQASTYADTLVWGVYVAILALMAATIAPAERTDRIEVDVRRTR